MSNECITYLGSFAGYELFSEGAKNIVVKSDVNEEWYAVMNGGMFHRQNHICNTWKELRKKMEHNKNAKELCRIFNREDLY